MFFEDCEIYKDNHNCKSCKDDNNCKDFNCCKEMFKLRNVKITFEYIFRHNDDNNNEDDRENNYNLYKLRLDE